MTTSLAAELAPMLALGALGSLHCAGMCGAFAVAVSSAGSRSPAATARRQAGYALGKATTYATLGLALSSGAGWIDAAGAGTAVAWAAGALLAVLGLRQLGLGLRLSAPHARLLAPLQAAARALVRLPGFAGAFGAGAANGLLPCGLSLGALALAATSSPAAAVLGPFLFGLATAPALFAVGLSAWLVRGVHQASRLRRLAPVLLGLALIAGGVLTAMRGLPHAHAAGTACCAGPP